ncbi:MAG: peptide deformylase [Chloroflexi bacterium]|nr:MAG: peptide deformylase [Chloroflexota bacterium]
MLLTIPDPMLRKKAEPVDSLLDITSIADELSRVRQENQGLGIAAPQIGKSLRIINFMYRGREYTIINPVIKNRKGAQWVVESCLSIPNKLYKVKRAKTLTLLGKDIHGKPIKLKFREDESPVAQHELDHLDGILIDERGIFYGNSEVEQHNKIAFSEEKSYER